MPDQPILACKGCGRTKPAPTGDPDDLHPSLHCGECPPWECEDCGQTCSAQALCPCWVSFDDLPMADIKALLTLDGFQLDHHPSASTTEEGNRQG